MIDSTGLALPSAAVASAGLLGLLRSGCFIDTLLFIEESRDIEIWVESIAQVEGEVEGVVNAFRAIALVSYKWNDSITTSTTRI